jgi:hypothetical protein
VLGVCFDAEGFEGEESFFKAGVASAGESSFFLFQWLNLMLICRGVSLLTGSREGLMRLVAGEDDPGDSPVVGGKIAETKRKIAETEELEEIIWECVGEDDCVQVFLSFAADVSSD